MLDLDTIVAILMGAVTGFIAMVLTGWCSAS